MSMALDEWRGPSHEAFEEVESVHREVETADLGSRLLTEQLNYAPRLIPA